MRAFLTGSSGFVGGWLTAHLVACGDAVTTLPDDTDLSVPGAAAAHLRAAAPDVVYHLAALTHVGRSWEDPHATYRVNVLGTVELLSAAAALRTPPRCVLVSSAEVYGPGTGEPIEEDAPYRPVTPYAASKAAAELAGVQAHLGGGLDVVRVRPFNHIGPGQADSFVVSALARRIVEAERSGGGEIAVGNLAAARDFTDVRDVVRAYRLLAEHGAAGDVYNVCSGVARPIESLVTLLSGLATTPIGVRVDPSLFRPVDVPVVVGSARRLAELSGWAPTIPLADTLADVLRAWRDQLGSGAT